jgi:hypothetical protein
MTRPARRLNCRKGGLPAPPLGCANSPPGEYLGNSEAQACAERAVARHAAFPTFPTSSFHKYARGVNGRRPEGGSRPPVSPDVWRQPDD